MSVSKIELKELAQEMLSGENLLAGNADILKELKVKLNVSLGDAEVEVNELVSLKKGSIVKMNKKANAPLDVFINGQLVARGMMVAVDDDFGIQITEIAS